MNVIARQLVKPNPSTEAVAPVAIVAALPGEMRTLRRAARLWGGARPHMALSGMGPKAAFTAAESLARAGAAGLVSFGYAGALKPGLASGTLILPEVIVSEYGARETIDRDWRDSLQAALEEAVPVATGGLLSAERMIVSAEEKRQIHAATGALGLDMESLAVAAAARRHGLGFMAVRVVLDEASHVVPPAVTTALGATGRVQPVRLARALVARPGDFAALIALAGAARAANRTLSAVCRLGGPRLGLVG